MLTNVYIIRKDLDKFFIIDPETDNWEWSKNLEDATIYATAAKAEESMMEKKTGATSYVYEIPYSIAQPQQRKRKVTKKPKGRIIKKGKSKKR
jgi:hypothetical protein